MIDKHPLAGRFEWMIILVLEEGIGAPGKGILSSENDLFRIESHFRPGLPNVREIASIRRFECSATYTGGSTLRHAYTIIGE